MAGATWQHAAEVTNCSISQWPNAVHHCPINILGILVSTLNGSLGVKSSKKKKRIMPPTQHALNYLIVHPKPLEMVNN